MARRANLTLKADQHRKIEEQIVVEMARPVVDDLKVSELKRLKLRLKEEISNLSTETIAVA